MKQKPECTLFYIHVSFSGSEGFMKPDGKPSAVLVISCPATNVWPDLKRCMSEEMMLVDPG